MSIDPVKIPQNVYREDRIIGPITLRQIMIVMICMGISYGTWAAMKSGGPVSPPQTALAWSPTVIGILFAFVKINGISLLRIVLLMLEKIEKPSRRIWTPRNGIYVNIVTKPPKKEESEGVKKHKEKNAHIEELSRLLDQGPQDEELEATPQDIEPEAAQATAPKPVNPKRIQTDEVIQPVDDIAEKKDDGPSLGDGLLRDISPPSHA